MAIKNNCFKFVWDAILDSELSSCSREESMSSEENDIRRPVDVVEYENYDYDSGAGSDEFDLLELGETSEEVCQIGDELCSIPYELYDLPDLKEILSMDVWNNVLTDNERLNLTKYLPDMNQETFIQTMKELFTCSIFHFGAPSIKLFNMLKGGLCQPRVAIYRQTLRFFQKHHHYHIVKKYQNTMVNNVIHMREALIKCREYNIEEKLQVLNLMKNEKTLIYEGIEKQEMDSSDWEDYVNVLKHPDNYQKISAEDPVMHRVRGSILSKRESRRDIFDRVEQSGLLVKWNHKDDLKEKGMTDTMQNGDRVLTAVEAMKMLANGEETESDSSQQFGEKSVTDFKKKKFDMKDNDQENHGYLNLMTEIPVMEAIKKDTSLENKSQKKPFTLITPTVHTGFSFSIIHLLSAIRMAMITLLPENLVVSNNGPLKMNNNMPCLTVQEIVNRVKSNPIDPCILETQEPLQDLVRGALKLFSSKSALLGLKGWKPLVLYEKSKKSWSYIGPISQISSDHEVTSPDAWGISYKMLVKLVDSFANWLKNVQDTLKQIGSLPAPPLTLTQINLNEKERFKDLKAQKSLNTITQSSEEIKDYFRKEENLRYLIPDRAFAYTALDGKKSTVAPSKKGAGKPTSKARDHFMLKWDRPPHVNILCLVRDAAARLPGSIGTRADVCTLIRDSQYIVEDVSDAQVNQIVSGALDRLHYERDPCVQFDNERKLWVYLHRERVEEDFEDDATSSTKTWKRQKKESDLNLEPPGIEKNKKKHLKDYLDASNMCETGGIHQGPSVHL